MLLLEEDLDDLSPLRGGGVDTLKKRREPRADASGIVAAVECPRSAMTYSGLLGESKRKHSSQRTAAVAVNGREEHALTL